MAYESPFGIMYDNIQYRVETELERCLLQAAFKVGITVDKQELLRALDYDRDQYRKGYADGRADRDAEIVRCKDCKWFDVSDPIGTIAARFEQQVFRCKRVSRLFMEPNAFCSYGERRDDNEL